MRLLALNRCLTVCLCAAAAAAAPLSLFALIAVLAADLTRSGAFIGLIGSIAFWPLAVYFPIRMYAAVHKPGPAQRALMLCVDVLTACLSLGAAAGSIADIVRSASGFGFGGF